MLSILLATCVLLTAPGNLEGKVVRIADGDTITVLVDRKQVKVRLSEIDAPEGDRTSHNGAARRWLILSLASWSRS